MATTATVRKIKRPWGTGARWHAYILHEDEHGLWLHSPAGSVHPQIAGDPWQVPWHGVQLLPRDRWWAAWWWDQPQERLVAVDICTPPALVDDVWTYEDLELDPVGNEAGFLKLYDVDEFEMAVSHAWMSTEEAEKALDTAEEIKAAMTGSEEPFGRAGWWHLDQAIRLGLPPL